MQVIKDDLQEAHQPWTECLKAADELKAKCGFGGQMEIQKQMEEVEALMSELLDGVKERGEELDLALARAERFEQMVGTILGWLPQLEQRMQALGPLASDSRALRVQLEDMKVIMMVMLEDMKVIMRVQLEKMKVIMRVQLEDMKVIMRVQLEDMKVIMRVLLEDMKVIMRVLLEDMKVIMRVLLEDMKVIMRVLLEDMKVIMRVLLEDKVIMRVLLEDMKVIMRVLLEDMKVIMRVQLEDMKVIIASRALKILLENMRDPLLVCLFKNEEVQIVNFTVENNKVQFVNLACVVNDNLMLSINKILRHVTRVQSI